MTKHTGKWQGIMLHHTAGAKTDNAASIRKVHKIRGWGDIGYHFVLEIKDGRGYLKQGRNVMYNGAHAGVDYYNKNYLGIVIPGNYSNYPVDSAVYNDLIDAMCHIIKKYGLSHIRGHREVKATQCPGNNINMDKVRADISKKIGYVIGK